MIWSSKNKWGSKLRQKQAPQTRSTPRLLPPTWASATESPGSKHQGQEAPQGSPSPPLGLPKGPENGATDRQWPCEPSAPQRVNLQDNTCSMSAALVDGATEQKQSCGECRRCLIGWSCVNARLHSPRTTESCSWDDIVASLVKERAQFEKEAAEVRARGLATSVTCDCCFFGCPFCIVWDEIDEERNSYAEEPNHDGEETREVFHIAGLRAPDAVDVVLEDFWGSLLDVAWESGSEVVENLWEVTAQQLQDMFGHVDSLSAARLLPSPVRCWARICCKVLCGECEPWHDSQALYDFVYLVLYNVWMQSEGNTMVLGRLDNEFQIAYHYEEDDGEEASDGSEPIELDADDYWDSFIIGEKEQLEWWYLKNSGPQLQLYYTNEDYYQDQVEDEEAESDVDAEEEEAEADVEADQDKAQPNEYYYQDHVEEEEAEAEEDFSEEIDDNSENKESSEHEPEESFSGGADDPAESKENRSYGSELSSPLQDVGPLESPDAFSFTAPVPVTAHSLSDTAHSQSRWCRYGTRCWRHKEGQCHFRHK